MKKVSVIISNADCDDLSSFDTLEEAWDEIERQKADDAKETDCDGDDFRFIYAVRDNELDEIVWAE